MHKSLYSPISDEELSENNRLSGRRRSHRRTRHDYTASRDKKSQDDRRYKCEIKSRREERESYSRRDRETSRHSKRDRKSSSKKKSSRKKQRHESSDSGSSSETSEALKSSSFIGEILRNKKTKDGEKILGEVIKSLSNDIEEASYTPPLKEGMFKEQSKPESKKIIIEDGKKENEDIKLKLDENGNIVTNIEKTVAVPESNFTPKDVSINGTVEKKHKKKSVLELPMPPEIKKFEPTRHNTIKHHERVRSKSESQSTKLANDDLNASLSDIPLPQLHQNEPVVKRKSNGFKYKNDHRNHFKEMQSHLKSKNLIFTPNIKSTPPEYLKPVRPSVIIKSKVLNTAFQNRLFGTYEIVEQVGRGTYGKVYRSIDLKTKETVAMKYIRMEKETEGFPITCLREIKILQQLDHPNIIKLRDIIFRDEEDGQTYLIFDYMNHDLLGLRINNQMKLDEQSIYNIVRQVLEGLNYCHKMNIIHRDLKLSNILVNNNGNVKICDFGLSRMYTINRPYTNKVISLWYRPIELLLGEEIYGPSVDIWSLGCIIVELFKRRPLFEYTSEIEIVNGIFQLCGTPEYNMWPEVKKLPKYKVFKPNPRMRVLNNSLFPALSPLAIDLVDKMLALNPALRITAEDALKSNWIARIEKLNYKPLELPKVDSFEMRASVLN